MDTTPSYNELIADALKTLLEYEQIEHETSIGIAKKIITDRGIHKLSPAQLNVYNNFIEPLLRIDCQNPDCGDRISLGDIPEAYLQEFEVGRLLCENCLYIEYRIAKEMEKDD